MIGDGKYKWKKKKKKKGGSERGPLSDHQGHIIYWSGGKLHFKSVADNSTRQNGYWERGQLEDAMNEKEGAAKGKKPLKSHLWRSQLGGLVDS